MDNQQVLIRLAAVIARTGKSKSAIYADKTFPKPILLGERAVAWLQSEVDEWIAKRIAAREETLATRSEAARLRQAGKSWSSEKIAA